MSEFAFSTEEINKLSSRTMLSDVAQSLIVSGVLVRKHPIDFKVTVGPGEASNPDVFFWYADVQAQKGALDRHPQGGDFGSGLPYDILNTSEELLAGGVRLVHDGEVISLIPPLDRSNRMLGVPVLRMLMARDLTSDLRFMPEPDGQQQPLIMPSLAEIEGVDR